MTLGVLDLRGRHGPPEGRRLNQYTTAAPARKLMKECAAYLSKVYGVMMVDASRDGGRLQGVAPPARAQDHFLSAICRASVSASRRYTLSMISRSGRASSS